MLTLFFPADGLAQQTPDDLEALVISEGLATFRDGERRICDVCAYVDDGGARQWSVNIVVGDDDGTCLDDAVPIWRHEGRGAPATLFNPTVPQRRAAGLGRG
jgi:hypothetical protein